MNRQERVQEVYNYLVFTHAIENQRGFANSLNRNEKNISRAIHETESVTAENVPLYRNRETTLHGNLFGSQQGMAIGIDDSWGEAAEKQW